MQRESDRFKVTFTIGLGLGHTMHQHNSLNRSKAIPKVALKMINQGRMFFADFSVNCQPIFMKFCNNHISTES